MSGNRRAWLRACLALLLSAATPAYAQDPRASAAVSAARAWLDLVDRGDVAASHKSAAGKFRGVLSDKEWAVLHDKERKPRGTLTQRALYQTKFDQRLPNVAGESEYALLEYQTSFANAPTARENVTLEREADGQWRVVGYFIR